MSNRHTITGVLHVRRQRKRRSRYLLEDLAAQELEDNGLLQRRWYKPIYWLTNGTPMQGRSKGEYMYRFAGQPKALAPELAGATVTVTAELRPFGYGPYDGGNGLGAMLVRPRITKVVPADG